MNKQKLQRTIFAGLMVSIGIVLSSVVSISYPPNSTIIRFGIGYLPLIILSISLGPELGFKSAIVQDILGYIVYIWVYGTPSGPFFPGFTLNSILYGVLPGLIYNLKLKNKNIFLYVNLVFLLVLLIMGIWGLANIGQIIDLIENRLSTDMQFDAWVIYMLIILGELGIIAIIAFLYKNRKHDDSSQRIIFSIMFLEILVTLILTPLWVSILYKIPFLPQLPLRIIKAPIEIFIYSLLLLRIIKSLKHYKI